MDMEISCLPTDLLNLCISYLSEDEMIYYKRMWEKFKMYDVCDIAAENGWLDLLIWAKNRL